MPTFCPTLGLQRADSHMGRAYAFTLYIAASHLRMALREACSLSSPDTWHRILQFWETDTRDWKFKDMNHCVYLSGS